uniref:Uncharacterized protein n=1 Tax=Arundo donax TaxID=35708 RepID=A0A0A9A4W0_ARUDO
MWQCVCTDG